MDRMTRIETDQDAGQVDLYVDCLPGTREIRFGE